MELAVTGMLKNGSVAFRMYAAHKQIRHEVRFLTVVLACNCMLEGRSLIAAVYLAEIRLAPQKPSN